MTKRELGREIPLISHVFYPLFTPFRNSLLQITIAIDYFWIILSLFFKVTFGVYSWLAFNANLSRHLELVTVFLYCLYLTLYKTDILCKTDT